MAERKQSRLIALLCLLAKRWLFRKPNQLSAPQLPLTTASNNDIPHGIKSITVAPEVSVGLTTKSTTVCNKAITDS